MLKKFDVFEEIEKPVVPFGNGSIVYTPKKWVGQTVRVILERQPFDINARIMELLSPNLEYVKGVFLHGSFARKEQSVESDIDVLVVTSKKFSIEKKEKFDFSIVTEEMLRKELSGKDPFYLHLALLQATPIINEGLLNELRQIKINKHEFGLLLSEAQSALKIVNEFLNLENKKKKSTLESTAIIHTMILRLRRIFSVQQLLKSKEYSNKEFILFLQSKGLSKKLSKNFFGIYRSQRNETINKAIVSIDDAKTLYRISQNEIEKMKKVLKEWHQRKN